MIDLSAYKLSRLQGGAISLYRGSAQDADPILVALPTDEEALPEAVRRLENAYSLRGRLDPSWAAQPLALIRHRAQIALTMRDPGGQLLSELLGRPLEVAEFLRAAIAAAAACRQMHEAGLIHGDIRPTNLLLKKATGSVWLTGFGVSGGVPGDPGCPEAAARAVGTLAYMAPEQTGRINRSMDFRSDLYSLGITFYEMLTGVLPFAPRDPREFIHCHIARQPLPPHHRLATVPKALSLIVAKLLSKNMEERYQSAAGLEVDLRSCIARWHSSGRIAAFPLAMHDCSLQYRFPRRLYGRDRELATLVEALRAARGHSRSKAVLVSGNSGVGKSALLDQLHKRQELRGALIAQGQCEEYKRDIPYRAIAHILQGLVRTVLGCDERELEHWRAAFAAALGPNAAVIMSLVPEFEALMERPPPLRELSAQDAQSRFQATVRRFLAVFARRDRPLFVFLDDLHWLDLESLRLLQHVLTHDEVRYLVVVGAYRDNEVTKHHPLQATLEEIRKSDGEIHEIALGPLRTGDLEDLLSDSLHRNGDRLAALASLIHAKTGGNPLFAIQFIAELSHERLLTFDPASIRWSWNLGCIRKRRYTDNVVDLMIGRLNRFPAHIKTILVQLACMGTRVDLGMLSLVRGESVKAVRKSLAELVRGGLIAKRDVGYAFLHDRLREAAYALLPESERPLAHLRIARALIGAKESLGTGEKVFTIADQLKRGVAAVGSADEREQVARFMLAAAWRAKATTAHSSALGYLNTAAALLGEDCWEQVYRLAFDLEFGRAECEFLTGQFAVARERLRALRARANGVSDQAAVARLRLALHVTLDEVDLAVAVGLDFLDQVGNRCASRPARALVDQEYQQLCRRLRGRPAACILTLPGMSNPEVTASMNMLADLMPPLEFTDPDLLDLVILRMANLSLEYGNCAASCYGYAALYLVLGPRFGDYELGYQFARLACALAETPDLGAFRARVHLCFGGFVIPWARPLSTGHAFIRSAFDEAHSTGDLTFASYSNTMLVTLLLASGARLDGVQQEAERGLSYARSAGFGLVVDCLNGQLMFIRSLRGLPWQSVAVGGSAESRDSFERRLEDPRLAIARCWYWIRKLQISFIMRDYMAAQEAAAFASTALWSTSRSFEQVEYHFYAALARAAVCDFSLGDQRSALLEQLVAHRAKLAICAQNCHGNFSDRVALIGAEIARLEGCDLEAERLYEEAIRSAREQEFILNEALANELASKFHAGRGFDTIARAYLANARKSYSRLGATAKARQLEESNSPSEAALSGGEGSNSAALEQFDLATVVKLSHAVSCEIDLTHLINTLMVLAVEHAGAERGLLILPAAGELVIEAEATTIADTVSVHQRRANITSEQLPQSILHYAARTLETVLLDNAQDPGPFSTDQYFGRRNCRSILCLPLVKQARLIGVLYLENHQAGGVFTFARVGVLRLLASQAAISLEIARVHAELGTENQERKRVEAALRASEASLELGQQISRTCSWRWTVRTGSARASAEWFRIYGVDSSVGPLSYATFMGRVHPDDRSAVRSTLARAVRTRSSFNFEFRIVLPDGVIKHLQCRGHPDISSGELEFVGTDMDITELREAEEKLRRTQADLARASKLTAMGELAGSIVHEINRPLAAVVTNAEAGLRWLNRTRPNLVEATHAIANVAREGRRAADVVSGLLSLARRSVPAFVNVDLHDAIREVLVLIRGELERGRVAYQLELCDADPTVRGDRVQIQQVLINLIRNGIEAMSGVTERIRAMRISSVPDGEGNILLAIEDTGVGMDSTIRERIFDPLFTTKPEGMGMGLAICRSIVDAHRGYLCATPGVPHGTILKVALPVVGAKQGGAALTWDGHPKV